MTRWGCIFLVPAVVCLFDRFNGADAQTTNPVRDVVKLLKDMKEQIDTEQKNDDKAFEEFTCLCNEQKKRLQEAIAALGLSEGTLAATIGRLRALMEEYQSELDGKGKEKSDNENSLEVQRQLYESEKAENAAQQANTEEAIAALSQALAVLKNGTSPASFAQVQAVAQRLEKAQLPKLMELGGHGTVALNEFIQYAKTKPNFLQAGGPFSSYGSQLGPVVGRLEQMLADFVSHKDQLIEGATKLESDYQAFKTAKENQIRLDTERISKLTEELAGATTQNQQSGTLLSTNGDQEATDKKSLADILQDCIDQTRDHGTRQSSRAAEATAIAETIALLDSDTAFKLFAKATSFFQSSSSSERYMMHIKERQTMHVKEHQAMHFKEHQHQSMNFKEHQSMHIKERQSMHIKEGQSMHIKERQSMHIKERQSMHIRERQSMHIKEHQSMHIKEGQMAQSMMKMRMQAAALLQRVAAQTGSKDLAEMAHKIMAGDPFDKIRQSITLMLDSMRKKQSDEVLEEDHCKKELADSSQKLTDEKANKGRLDLEITGKQGELDTCLENIKHQEGIIETDTEMKKTTQAAFAKEMADLKQTETDQTLMKDILTQATNKLKEMYSSLQEGSSEGQSTQEDASDPAADASTPTFEPYAKKNGGNIILKLEQIIVDVQRTLDAATQGQVDAREEQNSRETSFDSNIEQATQAITELTEVKSALKEELTAKRSDLTTQEQLLSTLTSADSDLHEKCDHLVKAFQASQAARAAEILALQSAMNFFNKDTMQSNARAATDSLAAAAANSTLF